MAETKPKSGGSSGRSSSSKSSRASTAGPTNKRSAFGLRVGAVAAVFVSILIVVILALLSGATKRELEDISNINYQKSLHGEHNKAVSHVDAVMGVGLSVYRVANSVIGSGRFSDPHDERPWEAALMATLEANPSLAAVYNAINTPDRVTVKEHRENAPLLATQVRTYVNASYQYRRERTALPHQSISDAVLGPPQIKAYDPFAKSWYGRGNSTRANVTGVAKRVWVAPVEQSQSDSHGKLLPAMELDFRIDWPVSVANPALWSIVRVKYYTLDLARWLDDIAGDVYVVTPAGTIISSDSSYSILREDHQDDGDDDGDDDDDDESPFMHIWEVPGFAFVDAEYLKSEGGPFQGGYVHVGPASNSGEVDWLVVIRMFDADVPGVSEIQNLVHTLRALEIAMFSVAAFVVFVMFGGILFVWLMSHRRTLWIKADATVAIDYQDLLIGSLLGIGSFGEVYRGEMLDGRQVAVKKLLHQDNITNDLMAAFVDEATTMIALSHPNIVMFVGVCIEPPHMAIVSEFLERGSLYNALHAKNNHYSKSLRVQWARDIANGLRYLHAHDMLHRDLKSPNVLLTNTFTAKLADFGMTVVSHTAAGSWSAHDEEAAAGGAVGSLFWTAPEVLKDATSYSPHADIYSFGIILWEIFSEGATLYPGKHAVNVAQEVMSANLRPPSSMLEAPIDALFTRTVEALPDTRSDLSAILSVLEAVSPASTVPILPSFNRGLEDGNMACVVFRIRSFVPNVQAAPDAFLTSATDTVTYIEATVSEFGGHVFDVSLHAVRAMFRTTGSAVTCSSAIAEHLEASDPHFDNYETSMTKSIFERQDSLAKPAERGSLIPHPASPASPVLLAPNSATQQGSAGASKAAKKAKRKAAKKAKRKAAKKAKRKAKKAKRKAAKKAKKNQVGPAHDTNAASSASSSSSTTTSSSSSTTTSSSKASDSSSSKSSKSSVISSSDSDSDAPSGVVTVTPQPPMCVTLNPVEPLVSFGIAFGHGVPSNSRTSGNVTYTGDVVSRADELSFAGPGGVLMLDQAAREQVQRWLAESGARVGLHVASVNGTLVLPPSSLISMENWSLDMIERTRTAALGIHSSRWITWNADDVTLGNRIGVGSSTETFDAVFTPSSEPVAAKRLLVPRLELDMQAFLISSAAKLCTVSHPNVVPWRAIVVQESAYMILLPKMAGSLAELVSSGVGDVAALGVAKDIARGCLHLTNSYGVIHGNLSLSNVLINDAGRAAVADYAMERLMMSTQTMTGVSRVWYLAPEVIRAGTLSQASDVYAFGILIYQLVTRLENPYPGIDSQMELAMRVMGEGLFPDVTIAPPIWHSLLKGCWVADPNKRMSWSGIVETLDQMDL